MSSSSVLKCSERTCTTGQDVATTGRKIVSDFFGRNKRETKTIPLSVWHVSCRKHYQRGAYVARTSGESKLACEYYLDQLKHQLLRIKLWRPQATFTIQLAKAAKTRLTNYHDALRRNGGNQVAATAAVAVAPKVNKKGETVALGNAEAVKMNHAEHIDSQFCGQNQGIGFVEGTIIPWIEGEIESGEMVQMPPIELLIDAAVPGEVVNDPATNYDRWMAECDGVAYAAPLPAAAAVQTTPPKRTLKLHGPRTPPRSPAPEVTSSSSSRRSGFVLKIKGGKATCSQSSSSSAGPSSLKRKASDAGIDSTAVPFKLRLTAEQKQANIDSIPFWVPPPPIVRAQSTPSKRRPAPLDLSTISNTGSKGKARVVESWLPEVATKTRKSISIADLLNSDHADTPAVVESSPIMARGMVFAGSKRLRSPVDDEYDDESEDDEPEAKKQKVSA